MKSAAFATFNQHRFNKRCTSQRKTHSHSFATWEITFGYTYRPLSLRRAILFETAAKYFASTDDEQAGCSGVLK